MSDETLAIHARKSKLFSYSRVTRLLGAAWFLILAILVAGKLGAPHGASWAQLLSNFCIAIFYLLLAVLIMSRPAAKAHSHGLTPKIAAFVGTYLPWTIGFFEPTNQIVPNLVASVCVLTGAIMMLVTIRHLGRSFSLVPQARHVVKTGPYRWIKHPLYLSEEIAIFGVVLQHLSATTALLLLAHIAIQVKRIRFEEDLLRSTCPDYAAYEASRWRLIPYVW